MRVYYLILACAMAVTAAAQPAARYQPKTRVWVLETEHTSYALGVNERNELQHLYWGKKLARDEDYPRRDAEDAEKAQRISLRASAFSPARRGGLAPLRCPHTNVALSIL
jgi:hypothetical protein